MQRTFQHDRMRKQRMSWRHALPRLLADHETRLMLLRTHAQEILMSGMSSGAAMADTAASARCQRPETRDSPALRTRKMW